MSAPERKAEHLLADQGVFKGHDGLRQFAECASFWQQMPYGTRFYFDDNLPGRYLHVSVLGAAVRALDTAALEAQESIHNVWVSAQANHCAYSNTGDAESDIRFLTLGLAGEAGELANFVKKRWRDGDQHTEEIQKEIADVCAYAFMLAHAVGMTPASLIATIAHKQQVFVEKMKARASLDNPESDSAKG